METVKDVKTAREVTVSADSSTSLVANIKMGGQESKIDESVADSGPDAYDYILSALGACTAITLHMYAKRKEWPLERVEVDLSHERVHTVDCDHSDENEAKLSQITKKLRLIGDLTPEQKLRLHEISGKCPVQKTLQAGLIVKTVLIEQV
ncbi:OsmC family protein [Pontibacter vulgaris]|uniref:OsmC family protein n=1 Tax=Pontibacter vulgaris TaxID=2905679 RepID=UPI001FA6C058|nr:OsmC family protein [Pontibacter vulgaris]